MGMVYLYTLHENHKYQLKQLNVQSLYIIQPQPLYNLPPYTSTRKKLGFLFALDIQRPLPEKIFGHPKRT